MLVINKKICGNNNGGFVLILVLVALSVLSALYVNTINITYFDHSLVKMEEKKAQSDADLRAAAQTALFHFTLMHMSGWAFNGHYQVDLENGHSVSVTTLLLDEKIPLNRAGPAMIDGLFRACKADARAAHRATVSLILWRSPATRQGNLMGMLQFGRMPAGHSLGSLADLRDVPGVTPGNIACIMRYGSIFQQAAPTPDLKDPVILDIVKHSALLKNDYPEIDFLKPQGHADTAENVVRIDCVLSGQTATRHARLVARLSNTLQGSPYHVLLWQNSGRPADQSD